MTNTLRVRRAERRLTQIKLAQVAGIHENRYWRIENGYTTPTDAERAALATALGVSEAVIWPELEPEVVPAPRRRRVSQPAA